MYAQQVYDTDVFVAAAKKHDAPVRVVRTASTYPVTRADAVFMEPVVLLQYSIQFEENGDEKSWVLREVVRTDDEGVADLADTLWSRLPQLHLRTILVHRSGSF
jgi:hypothetical protein